LLRIWTAPATAILFRDFYLADQLISLSITLMDMEFFVCYYATDIWDDGERCLTVRSFVVFVVVFDCDIFVDVFFVLFFRSTRGFDR
jgi:hypothetical protein